MFIDNDIKLDFNDVLILPKRSQLNSRSEVNLNRKITFKHSKDVFNGIPIIASNMDGVGTFQMAKVLQKYNVMTAICKHESIYNWIQYSKDLNLNYVIVSTGTRKEDLDKVSEIIETIGIKYICIDVANGYSQNFISFVEQVRKQYPTKTIIAGNIVSKEMVEALIFAGADIVKCGIGNGNCCTTRKQTGVGYPQLSTIIECANYAHGLNAHILSDGGCIVPGDVAKSFGAGADFQMIGSMFSGHKEGNQEIITKYTRKKYLDSIDDELYEQHQFVEFYGMSSKKAQEKHNNGLNDYRSSEGREVLIPYRGNIEDTLKNILGGIRSTCTYVGAKELKNLPKCCSFVRVNRQLSTEYEKYEV